MSDLRQCKQSAFCAGRVAAPEHRRGFAMVECAAVVLVVLAALVFLLINSGSNRGLAWQAAGLSNLREFATLTGMYGADYQDHYWSYSWQMNAATPSEFPDLQGPFPSDLEAQAAQYIDLLRRRTGRADFALSFGMMPHVESSHLVLADYLGSDATLPFAVSPGDRNLQLWSNDPSGFDSGIYQPAPSASFTGRNRFPYKSSYRLPPAYYSRDWRPFGSSVGTITPSTNDAQWSLSNFPYSLVPLGRRRTTEVQYPAQKVHLFDTAQWRPGTYDLRYVYPHARVTILIADGSAGVRSGASANLGFDPGDPIYVFPPTIEYSADSYMPPVITPTGVSYTAEFSFQGRYMWTRGGLQGRDFDGPEWRVP
jgi:hypothetical protein